VEMPRPMPRLRLGASGGLLSSKIVAQLPLRVLTLCLDRCYNLVIGKRTGFQETGSK
jgi:hypothetical protein